MSEVMVDLRKLDLSDRLGLDMISIDALLSRLEEALDEIERLNETIIEIESPYNPGDDFMSMAKARMEQEWI